MVKLCDFGSCSFGHTYLRDINERSNAKEVIDKETTPMYRAPEMIDLYLREELTEKTDIWVCICYCYYILILVYECLYMRFIIYVLVYTIYSIHFIYLYPSWYKARGL